MVTIKTIFRPSSKGAKELGSLYIRIIYKRKVKSITLPFKVYPWEWSSSTQSICFKNSSGSRLSDLSEINKQLLQILGVFDEIISTAVKQDFSSIEDVMAEYNLKTSKGSLSCFVKKICADLDKNGQCRTSRAYMSSLNKFLKFNDSKDFLLNDINSRIMKSFECELKECGLKLNTISFYIRNMRVIYNKAVEQGYIKPSKENPFQKVYTKTQKTRKRALSIDEINSLNKIDFRDVLTSNEKESDLIKKQTEKLYFSWRLFFFCFYSRGMSFVDLAYLRKENLQGGFLNYYRKKSGQYVSIKITQSMQEIIDSFANDVKDSQYLFPIISDKTKSARTQYESALRVQNSRLKRISKMAHLNSILSTHVSRHSWASIAKEINLPISIISEGLGHANELTTSIYLSSFDHSVLDNANEAIIAIANNKRIKNSKCYNKNRNQNKFYCIS